MKIVKQSFTHLSPPCDPLCRFFGFHTYLLCKNMTLREYFNPKRNGHMHQGCTSEKHGMFRKIMQHSNSKRDCPTICLSARLLLWSKFACRYDEGLCRNISQVPAVGGGSGSSWCLSNCLHLANNCYILETTQKVVENSLSWLTWSLFAISPSHLEKTDRNLVSQYVTGLSQVTWHYNPNAAE